MRAVRPSCFKTLDLSRAISCARLLGSSHLPESVCRAICDRVPARWHGGKCLIVRRERNQRRIRLPFDRRCAQFDLNCATVHRPPHCRSWHSERHEPAELPFGRSYQSRGELARRILAPHAMICSHESATLLPDLLCARIGPPLRAICAVAIGARLECCVVLS